MSTTRDLRVVVVGAGMAGIMSAIRLIDAGIEDVVLYEKADGPGGTWRANTYPGIACDVPSHLYSYSFSPNPDWSHVFSPGPEILAYLERVAHERGITDRTRFNTEVRSLRFGGGGWNLETTRGEKDYAQVVIAATGVLHHPAFPDIEGTGDFDGPVFHSAAWDHTHPLWGKRVGIVGTGSSAVQIVGAIVDEVAELSLFQRTAQWVLPVPNPPIEEPERIGYRQDPSLMRQMRDALGTMFEQNFANAVVDVRSPQIQMLQAACEANLEENVKDPELRRRLRPDYRAACKRLIVSPNFYDAIQRPNAHLVTEKIDRIEPKGIRTVDGELHDLDIIVLATGFRVDRFMRPMTVVGRDGTQLERIWSKRPYAYLSISIPDFPNLFMLNGPNGPVGNFSLIDVAELQMSYVMQLIELLREGRYSEVSASQGATSAFEEARAEAATHTIWMTGCKSWYLDDRGLPAVWPWTFDRFREEMAKPKLEAYDLR